MLMSGRGDFAAKIVECDVWSIRGDGDEVGAGAR
jgi:glycerol dehydrogenase-like iron-containing ADH family enzyme